jgi:hypothetical protein
VITVIRQARNIGLPDGVTNRYLERIGIPSGNISRTLAALRFLGLVEAGGEKTPIFEQLARAPDDEYPRLLSEVIRSAYAEVFQIVDPAEDEGPKLHNAFRQYNPQAQRTRMVTLFVGLCREAGIVTGELAERPPVRVRRPQPVKSAPAAQRKPQKDDARASTTQPLLTGMPVADQSARASAESRYAWCEWLLSQLPLSSRRWTSSERERWLDAFSASLDVLVKVVDEDSNLARQNHTLAPADEDEPQEEADDIFAVSQ